MDLSELWICGHSINSITETELEFNNPNAARDALIVLLRESMSDAFEVFDMTRATYLREILEQIKDEDTEIMETGWSGTVMGLGETWFIKKKIQ